MFFSDKRAPPEGCFRLSRLVHVTHFFDESSILKFRHFLEEGTPIRTGLVFIGFPEAEGLS
jgi:hypothetical protein